MPPGPGVCGGPTTPRAIEAGSPMCDVRNTKKLNTCESLQNILMSVYPILNGIKYYVTNCYVLSDTLITLFREETGNVSYRILGSVAIPQSLNIVWLMRKKVHYKLEIKSY